MTQAKSKRRKGFLFDVRVLELAGVQGEFCGKLLAGAGADVVKVEPPEGSPTRRIGPFYQDEEGPERSLHFWHYNLAKRGVTLDVTKPEGQALLKALIPSTDVLLETFPAGAMEKIGLGYDALSAVNPRLVMASITPFGQSGPWRDWKASDLVHLALGGIMMNCGYDRTPEGEFDTPPIAPQMWHSSHIAGEQTYMAIVAALLWREQTGRGQYIDAPIHQIVNTNTEMDIPTWVYQRVPVYRQTGRHAGPRKSPNTNAITKDGRYLLISRGISGSAKGVIDMLADNNVSPEFKDPKYRDPAYLGQAVVQERIDYLTKQWVMSYRFDRNLWEEGQKKELHWSPVRKPEENLADDNWRERATFAEVRHEDLGRTLTYLGAPWLAETCPWRTGPRAPHLGEHNAEVYGKELGLSARKLAALRRVKVI